MSAFFSKRTLWTLILCLCCISLAGATSLPTYRIALSGNDGCLPEGTVLNVNARLYDSDSSGILILVEEHRLEMIDGALTLDLGKGQALYDAVGEGLEDLENYVIQFEIEKDTLYPLFEVNQQNSAFRASGEVFSASIEQILRDQALDVPYSPMMVLAGDTATVPFQFQVGDASKYIRLFSHGSDLDILSTVKLHINNGNNVPVAIGEGGVSNLTVSGRVGIGVSAPSGALHLKQPLSGEGAAIRIERNFNANFWELYPMFDSRK